jgi:formate dehydrogenase iron-sulfur subunit
VEELKKKAEARLAQLRGLGFTKANIYGINEAGGLNVFYLFMDDPTVYGQPINPVVPQRRLFKSTAITVVTAIAIAAAALMSFRERGTKKENEKIGR